MKRSPIERVRIYREFWSETYDTKILQISRKVQKFKCSNFLYDLQTEFQLQQIVLIFWRNFSKKGYFWSKTEKNKHDHSIFHIQISLSTKFHLKLTIFNFWNKCVQKGYFLSKADKMKTTIEFCIFELWSRYQISLWTNNFKFLEQICPKTLFLVRSKINEWINK